MHSSNLHRIENLFQTHVSFNLMFLFLENFQSTSFDFKISSLDHSVFGSNQRSSMKIRNRHSPSNRILDSPSFILSSNKIPKFVVFHSNKVVKKFSAICSILPVHCCGYIQYELNFVISFLIYFNFVSSERKFSHFFFFIST